MNRTIMVAESPQITFKINEKKSANISNATAEQPSRLKHVMSGRLLLGWLIRCTGSRRVT